MDNPLTDEEIEHAWYSLGLRGGASANEWQTRYKFAREIEKLIKAQVGLQNPIL
jgi:hypothetical protein